MTFSGVKNVNLDRVSNLPKDTTHMITLAIDPRSA